MHEPLVSIITVNFNQPESTCALLDSIRRQEFRRVEIVVADNGSRENPEHLFAANYPEVKFIRSERNLGFAGGNNLGLKLASGDYLFFVNNDAELTPACIRILLQLFENQPDAGAASPLICSYPDSTVIQYAGMTPVHPLTGRNRTMGSGEKDRGQYTEARPTAYAHGAAMMVPRQVLDRVGPMEEGFFLYYEELDWCERMRRADFSVWIEPLARVYHRESLTVEKLGALKTYYLNRNRVWFMRRNYGGWRLGVFYVFLFVATIPRNVLLYLLRGEKENLNAFLRGVWWNFGSKFSKERLL